MTTAQAEPDTVVRATRALALGGLISLIALGLAWELWLAPTGTGTLALKVVPLVLCVAGLLRHRMYTFRWLSLLVWLYFLEGVVRATSETGISAALAMGEIVLSVSLFAVSGFYIRWRLRNGARMAAAVEAEKTAAACAKPSAKASAPVTAAATPESTGATPAPPQGSAAR